MVATICMTNASSYTVILKYIFILTSAAEAIESQRCFLTKTAKENSFELSIHIQICFVSCKSHRIHRFSIKQGSWGTFDRFYIGSHICGCYVKVFLLFLSSWSSFIQSYLLIPHIKKTLSYFPKLHKTNLKVPIRLLAH